MSGETLAARVEALIDEWETKAQRSLESAQRGSDSWIEHMTRRATRQADIRDLRAALTEQETL